MVFNNNIVCVLIVALSSNLISCRPTNSQASHVKDIAMTSTRRDTVYLYWKDGGLVVRGRCDVGRPVLRHYCQNETVSVDWNFVATTLMDGQDAQLNQSRIDEQELIKHLAAIDEELKIRPHDFDLSAVRADTAKELSFVRNARINLEANVALIEGFLVKIGSGSVVYRMSVFDERYLSLKPLLERLNRFFGGTPENRPTPQHAKTPIPAGSSAPDYNLTSTWSDPVTGKTYIAVTQPQPFENALATCRGMFPGRWELIGPFLPDVQSATGICPVSGTEVDAGRLTRFVVGSIHPRQFQDGSQALVVWSRCGLVDGQRVVLDFGPNGPIQKVIAPSAKLPVICELVFP